MDKNNAKEWDDWAAKVPEDFVTLPDGSRKTGALIRPVADTGKGVESSTPAMPKGGTKMARDDWLDEYAKPADAEHDDSDYAAPKKSMLTSARDAALDVAGGVAETVAGGLAGAANAVASDVYGAGGGLRYMASGKPFSEGYEATKGAYEQATEPYLAPETATGKAIANTVGPVFQKGKEYVQKGAELGETLAAGLVHRKAQPKLASELAGAGVDVGSLYLAGKSMLKPAEKPAALSRAQVDAAAAQERGYTLPPSESRPTMLNELITGWGGKIKNQQEASIKNQPVTNMLVKKALALPDAEELSHAALDKAIGGQEGGGAYKAVAESGVGIKANVKFLDKINNLGDQWRAAAQDYPELAKSEQAIGDLQGMLAKPEVSAEGAITMVKLLRKKASANATAYGDEAKMALGRAQRHAAFALDDLIKDNLDDAGKGQLATDYIKAREYIAKSYDVKSALNDSTGNVDAHILGRILSKKHNLTGELKEVADFANQHRKLVQTPEKMGAVPSISPLDVAAGGIEAAPALAAGQPGLAAGIVSSVAGRPLVRKFGLSDYYQKHGASAKSPANVKLMRKMATTTPLASGLSHEQEKSDEDYINSMSEEVKK